MSVSDGSSDTLMHVLVLASRRSDNPYSDTDETYVFPRSYLLRLSVGAAIYRTDLNGTVTVQVQPGGKYTLAAGKGTGTPPRTAPAPPTPAPVPSAPSSVNYPNCAAVRVAGKSPLLRGQPGYRAGLDRDGDGRACE